MENSTVGVPSPQIVYTILQTPYNALLETDSCGCGFWGAINIVIPHNTASENVINLALLVVHISVHWCIIHS